MNVSLKNFVSRLSNLINKAYNLSTAKSIRKSVLTLRPELLIEIVDAVLVRG